MDLEKRMSYNAAVATSTPIKDESSKKEGDFPSTGYRGCQGVIVKQVGDHCEVQMDFCSPKMVVVSADTSTSELDDHSSNTNKSMVALIERMGNVKVRINAIYKMNSGIIKRLVYCILLLLYIAYFTCAIYLDAERARPIIVITALVVFIITYNLLKSRYGQHISEFSIGINKCVTSRAIYFQWIVALFLLGAIITMIVVLSIKHPRNLISLAGFVGFVSFLYLFSYRRTQVRWRPVIGGFVLQFLLALIILRWQYGYIAFKYIGQKIAAFLAYTDYGCEFVFGKDFRDHFFAFQVLPVIVFFSCIISTFYYLGVMQAVIGKIAWVMRITLGTTAAESLSAAGNIFVGQTEAPILIRPFLEMMTRSELHAVMTGGFATIAGSVLAAYIKFGVPAEHLLCASVMNAPCALAVSKLFYPETELSQLKSSNDIPMPKRTERNLIEAAAAGASASISLVANIAANLIAFLALLAFINSMLSWLGGLVDFPLLSFQLICSYLFRPVAFLMGVDWRDAPLVGELIGIKTFLNEFVAYEKLSEFIKNRVECRDGPSISVRSEVIATYALCGFANLSSIGIQLGGIGPMAPSRRGDLAQVAVRALVSGTIVCFVTASIAGMLVDEGHVPAACRSNGTVINDTISFNDTYSTLLGVMLRPNGTVLYT